MKTRRGFASDNNAGVHPRVMEALLAANRGHVLAYGADPFTGAAELKLREHFGADSRAFLVYGGTGANVLGLGAVTRPHEAVVCASTAHINVDECGAPEKIAGCKLLPLATPDGKLRPASVEPLLADVGDQHRVQPRVISVSQPTELGTVYTVEELRRLSEFAHARGMLLHVDGARLSNAAAHLGLGLGEMTAGAGVDVLSFGGTKNGMMYGEAVVFTRAELAGGFEYVRKQGAQLPSKMRFVAAQFDALLTDDLWLENARRANAMARMLAREFETIPRVRLTQAVESNAVFAVVPPEHVARIHEEYFFYVWNPETSEARFMASFDTAEEDVRGLARVVRETLG